LGLFWQLVINALITVGDLKRKVSNFEILLLVLQLLHSTSSSKLDNLKAGRVDFLDQAEDR